MGDLCAQQLGAGPLPSYTLGYIYRPCLSGAIPPLWPPLILRQVWKKGTKRLEPLVAFFVQHMEMGKPELYQQYLLQLVATFITQVLQRSVRFSCPYIPPANFVLTIDYLSLASVAISSAKGESNVKAAEWRNLFSTFTWHHWPLQPPGSFYAVLHGKVNLQQTVLRTKALLHIFWYYYRLEDTSISFPFHLAFPQGSSFPNILPLPLLCPKFSVLTPYPSQNTMPQTRSTFPPVLSWAENIFLCLKGPYCCSHTSWGDLRDWIG